LWIAVVVVVVVEWERGNVLDPCGCNDHCDDYLCDKFHRLWGVETDNSQEDRRRIMLERRMIRWDKTCSNNRAHDCVCIGDGHPHFGDDGDDDEKRRKATLLGVVVEKEIALD
jgi:hypothetical protein